MRVGTDDSNACMYCSSLDIVEGIVFICEKWKAVRNNAHRILGCVCSSDTKNAIELEKKLALHTWNGIQENYE